MGRGIHEPGDVPGEKCAIDNAPQKPLHAKLQAAGGGACPKVTHKKAAHDKQRGLYDVHPQVHSVAFEPHVKTVAQHIAGVLVIRFGARGFAILDEQPADVAPKPTHLRRVGVGLMVRMLMMHPMDNNPTSGRLLQIADTE